MSETVETYQRLLAVATDAIDEQRRLLDDVRRIAQHTGRETGPGTGECDGDECAACLVRTLWHNDGDECTGPTCGNPAHFEDFATPTPDDRDREVERIAAVLDDTVLVSDAKRVAAKLYDAGLRASGGD